jgi:hypothetical protein
MAEDTRREQYECEILFTAYVEPVQSSQGEISACGGVIDDKDRLEGICALCSYYAVNVGETDIKRATGSS